jgi:hypothetical protein
MLGLVEPSGRRALGRPAPGYERPAGSGQAWSSQTARK